MDASLFNLFLLIHIAGGTLGLLAGTYIMIAKKGDRMHKRVGKIFSISMLGAGICSLVLATMHRNDFLFVVGIFTIYMAGTGWRYLYLRNIAKGQKPFPVDWLLMGFMLLGNIGFVAMGILSVLDKEYFGAIIFIFAWRGIGFVVQDYKAYRGHITVKNYWLVFHLQRMTGAYIASLTAFAVVNAPNRLSFLPWLLPAAIFVPLIVRWTRKYRMKAVNQ
ncbi:hypothetical protein [Flavobacterium sp. BFFFF1]|uniref:hypothetical protein n=1 Tax=Flavobacterium sp. BFFFF1 TaxID=2015557 RepID=UPI0025BCF9D3|nr:hypothetical protein [Flavobacterium sp. BFFFF1]